MGEVRKEEVQELLGFGISDEQFEEALDTPKESSGTYTAARQGRLRCSTGTS